MNQVKAKFTCTEVRQTLHGNSVSMKPVVSGSKDNEQFYKHTPGGAIELSIVNPALDGFFRPGTEYEVTFAIPVPVEHQATHGHQAPTEHVSQQQAMQNHAKAGGLVDHGRGHYSEPPPRGRDAHQP